MDAFENLKRMSHADTDPLVQVDAFMECPICTKLMGGHSPTDADRCLIQLGKIQGRVTGED